MTRGLFDFIDLPTSDGHTICRKYPSVDISVFSKLYVRESQEAVVYMRGRSVGRIGPGEYYKVGGQLLGELFPNLRGLFHRAPTVPVDIWLIDKRNRYSNQWATDLGPVQVFDRTLLAPIEIRAYGTYDIQISDSLAFVQNLVGMSDIFTDDTLVNLLRPKFATYFQSALEDVVGVEGGSVLQRAIATGQIGSALEARIGMQLATCGIVLCNLVATVSVDAAVMKRLQELGLTQEERRRFGNHDEWMDYQRVVNDRIVANGLANAGGGQGHASTTDQLIALALAQQLGLTRTIGNAGSTRIPSRNRDGR